MACTHGTGADLDETPVSVIVQAPDLQHAVRAVALAGGTVTHELGIIRAVGATLTPSQLELVKKVTNVRVRENRAVTYSVENTTGMVRDETDAGRPGESCGPATESRMPRE
jgi:hypothetical protein